MAQETAQYVTFGIEQDVFGIPITLVREVLDMRRINRLPQAPVHVLGMIDVRGEAVPVIDLRVKLGMAAAAQTPTTRIVVLDMPASERSRALGVLVDCVFEVTELDGAALEPPPSTGGRWRAECIAGIGRRNEAFVIVFDLPRLLAEDSVALAGGQHAA